MTLGKIILGYLAGILVFVLLGFVFTYARTGLELFDLPFVVGLTMLTAVDVVKTLGPILAINIVLGLFLHRLELAFLWLPIGTAMIIVSHHLTADEYGLEPVLDLGFVNTTMLYLPLVGISTLLGALIFEVVFFRMRRSESRKRRVA